ncbi:hypothetical protein [Pseudonocardia parietis]|uniref:Uncharacterized protein n=1 Tax=Pseudonocardia parietis TaxID=570936 RepID=A0ABS4W2N0_9PSEU|nr:hypothetical protein [Pseudonocardia parietis]MBP2370271.1 hypothetical protein [Pseudonocardia parietis]
MKTAPAAQPVADPAIPRMLRAVADHLDANPDLTAPASIFSIHATCAGGPLLQIQLHRTTADAFDRWAESIGTTTRIERDKARANGHIGTHSVDVLGLLIKRCFRPDTPG